MGPCPKLPLLVNHASPPNSRVPRCVNPLPVAASPVSPHPRPDYSLFLQPLQTCSLPCSRGQWRYRTAAFPTAHNSHAAAVVDGRCGAACVIARDQRQPSTCAGSRARRRPRDARAAPPPPVSVRSHESSVAPARARTPGHDYAPRLHPRTIQLIRRSHSAT